MIEILLPLIVILLMLNVINLLSNRSQHIQSPSLERYYEARTAQINSDRYHEILEKECKFKVNDLVIYKTPKGINSSGIITKRLKVTSCGPPIYAIKNTEGKIDTIQQQFIDPN